jgi:hypothetical protein
MLVTLDAESSVKSEAPPLLTVTAPEPVNVFAVTEVNDGVVVIAMLLQVPPDPRVITSPPPLKFPVPLAQVICTFPWTEVLTAEP